MSRIRISLLTVFFLISLFREARSQEALDSADKLYSAQFAASQRTQNGFLNEALSASKDALKTGENRFGPTHLAMVPLWTDLATLYRIMGRFGEAESALKWGLAIREKALGSENPLVGEALCHLSSLYNDWGKWSEAEFWGEKAVSLFESKGNETDLAKALRLLGEVELNLQNNKEAVTFLSRSLAVLEKTSTPSPQKILFLETLAKAYLANKQMEKAELTLLEAQAVTKKNFPADSIEAGDMNKKLGDFYFTLGQKEKSKPLFDAALKIDKGFVGVYYGYSALPYLHRLSEAYLSTGDYPSAKDLLEKALNTSRESLGNRHPLVAITLLRLARAETLGGDKKGSRDHREEALLILESLFPKNHPLILSLKTELGK